MIKYARIESLSGPRFCEVEGETLWVLESAPWWSGTRRTEERLLLKNVTLLSCAEPSKIVCVGQNYRKHAQEMGRPIPEEPLLFLKPPSALNGANSPIRLPPESEEVHYEAEVGLVIGERLTRASEAEAARAIFAVTCFNDVTARDIQKREIQHTRAKGFDTFACAGPWMVTGLSPNDLRVQARVNGKIRQDGRTSDMVFSPARLVSFISHAMTLLPGDLISTGTPSGVGPMNAGDTVEIEVEGVGVLVNPVIRA
jgi:2-keto-4-pentenoate hydratase/2-oxohepta-3-ene-1,7-dioic acid hydratase in catechol pathway